MNHPIVSFHLLNSKEECIQEAVQSAISCVEQDTPVVIFTGPINSAGFLKRMIYQDRTELDMRKAEDCQAVQAFIGKQRQRRYSLIILKECLKRISSLIWRLKFLKETFGMQ